MNVKVYEINSKLFDALGENSNFETLEPIISQLIVREIIVDEIEQLAKVHHKQLKLELKV